MKLQATSLQLGKIQNLVHQLQQPVGRQANQTHSFAFSGGELHIVKQHIVEAQNSIHGGAQFVAYRRHKLVFVGL